jgi:hypothetical protein
MAASRVLPAPEKKYRSTEVSFMTGILLLLGWYSSTLF